MTYTNAVEIASPPTEDRYDLCTQSIHWLTLLIVVIAFVAGLVMEEMPRGPEKVQLLNLHASIGVILFALTTIRLTWRLAVPPLQSAPGPQLLRLGAKVVHVGLYLVLFAIPITGLLMMAAKGRAIEVFGLFTLPPLVSTNRAFAHSLEEVHEALAIVLLCLVGVHTAAALLHRFMFRESVLYRMFPFRAKTDAKRR
ncbi:cytochrome b [Rhodopseudomonas palustris]|uniref:cytochrome b n=1 Tax=Rhodopseudomonas palustris TaxID=1076 RepID=UPI000E5A66FE|nr:cytochrome b [Rhodopseudomonas palustris]QLH71829.1 cytochrome b [Rhodopseudomonas palustris]RIA01035.1 cytochrome b [Rhodopseudomonas palustris]